MGLRSYVPTEQIWLPCRLAICLGIYNFYNCRANVIFLWAIRWRLCIHIRWVKLCETKWAEWVDDTVYKKHNIFFLFCTKYCSEHTRSLIPIWSTSNSSLSFKRYKILSRHGCEMKMFSSGDVSSRLPMISSKMSRSRHKFGNCPCRLAISKGLLEKGRSYWIAIT
jgi:hypothetical protein